MKTLSIVVLLITICPLAMAQQRNNQFNNNPDRRNQPRGQQDRPGNQHGKDALVHYLAGSLMLMNDSTIQMSQIAEQKSSRPEVKQFAQTLIQAHRQLNQKLTEFAPHVAQFASSESRRHEVGFRGTDTNIDATQDAENRLPRQDERTLDRNRDSDRSDRDDARGLSEGKVTDERTFAKTATRQPMRSDLVSQILKIKRQATNNFIQSTSQALQEHQNQDFDMAYLGFQIGSHSWALAELKAMQSAGEPEFQQLVRDATTSVQQHLQQAKQLSKKFEDDRSLNRSNQRTDEFSTDSLRR